MISTVENTLGLQGISMQHYATKSSSNQNLIINSKLNINTIKSYFTLFCQITLLKTDGVYASWKRNWDRRTHLFREKKSPASHRPFKLSSIWLFSLKQRNNDKFVLIPLKKGTEDALIPLIKKHVKIKSTIYSDSFSVYANNYKKESN